MAVDLAGSAFIQVRASGEGFPAEVEAMTAPGLDAVALRAGEAGKAAGTALSDGLASGAREGTAAVDASVGTALTGVEAEAGAAGAKAGESFAAGLDSRAKAGAAGLDAEMVAPLAAVEARTASSGAKAGESFASGLSAGSGRAASAVESDSKKISGSLGRTGLAGAGAGSAIKGGMGKANSAVTALTGGVVKNLGTGVVLAAATAAGATIKMATDFQTSMMTLVTGAGESKSNIKAVSDGILGLAGTTATSTKQLSDGMYLIESAGFHGADGLNVLKAAAQGAKVGNADLKTVADGLTTAMTDYNIPTAQAAAVTSQLVTTVASGKTTMGDLAGSLSNVLPAASAAHVGLADVLGAMATMTSQGISADQASQNLANTIRSLQNPAAGAVKEMAAMGLQATDVAKGMAGPKGFTDTILGISDAITKHMGPDGLVLQNSFNQSKYAAQDAAKMLSQLPPGLQAIGKGYMAGTVTQKEWMKDLKSQPALVANLGRQFATQAKASTGFNDTLKKGGPAAATFTSALSQITGGATGLGTMLALTGAHAQTFGDNMTNISDAAHTAGGGVKGFADVTKDTGFKLDQAKAAAGSLGIKIGTALLPIVNTLAGVFTHDVIPAISGTVDWIQKNKDVLEPLVLIVGSMLAAWKAYSIITKIVAAAQLLLNGALWANPIGLVVALVAGLAVGMYELYKHFKPVREAVKEFGKILMDMGKVILIVLGAALAPFIAVPLLIVKNWKTIKKFFGDLWPNIKKIFSEGIKAIIKFFTDLPGNILHALEQLPILLAKAAGDAIGLMIVGLLTAAVALWDFWTQIIPKVLGFLEPLPGKLLRFGIRALKHLVSGIASVAGDLWDFFSKLPGRVLGFIESLPGRIADFGSKVIHHLVFGVENVAGDLFNFFEQMPGQILGLLESLPGMMIGAGESIINGIIQGIENMAGALIHSIEHTVTNALPGFVKSALGIGSPSRVFAVLGHNVMEGMALGIDTGGHLPMASIGKAVTGIQTKAAKSLSAWPAAGGGMGAAGALSGQRRPMGGGHSITFNIDATHSLDPGATADAAVEAISAHVLPMLTHLLTSGTAV